MCHKFILAQPQGASIQHEQHFRLTAACGFW